MALTFASCWQYKQDNLELEVYYVSTIRKMYTVIDVTLSAETIPDWAIIECINKALSYKNSLKNGITLILAYLNLYSPDVFTRFSPIATWCFTLFLIFTVVLGDCRILPTHWPLCFMRQWHLMITVINIPTDENLFLYVYLSWGKCA